MDTNQVLFIDTKLSPQELKNDKVSLLGLLCKIRPQWNSGDICLKPLGGGNINMMFCCSVPAAPDDKIIVRINPDFERMQHISRDFEFFVMKTLMSKGLIAPVYARFQNGFVYKFVEGKMITDFKWMYDTNVRDLILQKAHPVFNIPLSELYEEKQSVENNIHYRYIKYTSKNIVERFEDPQLQERFCKAFISKDNVLAEAKFSLSLAEDIFAKHRLIFGHGDLWCFNIILDEEKNDVHFVDWEMCGPSTEILELGMILEDWADSYAQDEETEKALRKSWIKAFLETSPIRSGSSVTDELINDWYKDVIKGICVLRLMAVVWYLWIVTEIYDKEEIVKYVTDAEGAMAGYWKYKAILQKLI